MYAAGNKVQYDLEMLNNCLSYSLFMIRMSQLNQKVTMYFILDNILNIFSATSASNGSFNE